MALAGEMIKLIRLDKICDSPQGGDILELRVVKEEPLVVDRRVGVKVRKTGALEGARSTDGSMHGVALL